MNSAWQPLRLTAIFSIPLHGKRQRSQSFGNLRKLLCTAPVIIHFSNHPTAKKIGFCTTRIQLRARVAGEQDRLALNRSRGIPMARPTSGGLFPWMSRFANRPCSRSVPGYCGASLAPSFLREFSSFAILTAVASSASDSSLRPSFASVRPR